MSIFSFSMLFTDWNNSGTADLRMANDREYYEGGQEQMWQVRPGEPPKLYTKADGWAYLRIWGMGLAGYDLDGDGYHPAANKEKMRAGVPLNDDDRWPWLETLALALKEAAGQKGAAVGACSALKRDYRERLRVASPGLRFAFLDIDRATAPPTRRTASR